MNQSADEEEHAGSFMNAQGHPEPAEPCAHLKEDENHVQNPQEQNDRDSSYLHWFPSHGQVGWMPRLVGGDESRPCNRIFISRKPRPVGGELYSPTVTITVAGPWLPWMLQLA
jgi:hypothetical protein